VVFLAFDLPTNLVFYDPGLLSEIALYILTSPVLPLCLSPLFWAEANLFE